MQLLSVENVGLDVVRAGKSNFDAAIFAAGYESRSFSLATQCNLEAFDKIVVFSFSELKSVASHIESKAYYRSIKGAKIIDVKGSDDVSVYTALNGLVRSLPSDRTARVAVDYSSMSRVWYGAILNFFRFLPRTFPVELYFAYLQGDHKGQVRAIQVQVITTVPGFEGIAAVNGRSSAVFALGFDPWCAYAVMERIEPDEIVALLAERPDDPAYVETAHKLNKDFIHDHAQGRCLVVSTLDTEGAFKILCESAVHEFAKASEVTLVGLGPKTHILAMLLTAMRFPRIAIVQARGKVVSPQNVQAADSGTCTKIVFVPQRKSVGL